MYKRGKNKVLWARYPHRQTVPVEGLRFGEDVFVKRIVLHLIERPNMQVERSTAAVDKIYRVIVRQTMFFRVLKLPTVFCKNSDGICKSRTRHEDVCVHHRPQPWSLVIFKNPCQSFEEDNFDACVVQHSDCAAGILDQQCIVNVKKPVNSFHTSVQRQSRLVLHVPRVETRNEPIRRKIKVVEIDDRKPTLK